MPLKTAIPLNVIFLYKNVVDLSLEALYVLVGQGAKKLRAIKVCALRESNPGRPKSSDPTAG